MLNLTKKFLALPNGETIAYLERGHGAKKALLIHGNMSSSLHYLPLIERLDEAEFHVIAVDLRGFGDSSYKTRFDSLLPLMEDVRMLMELKGFHPAIVAGWSAGGGVAMLLASRYPHLVKKLFLIESMSHKGIPVFKKDQMGKPLLGQVYENKEALALDPVQVAPVVKALADNNAAFMDYIWGLVIYTVNKPEPEANKLYIQETMKQRNLVDFDWALVTFNLGTGTNFQVMGDETISQVSCPVFSVWGRHDITVLEYMVKETVYALKEKATLKIYEKCGHSPLVDVPDELAADFIAFASK